MTVHTTADPGRSGSSPRLLTIASTRAQLVKASLVGVELEKSAGLSGRSATTFVGALEELELASDALRLIRVPLPPGLAQRCAEKSLDSSVRLATDLLTAQRPDALVLYGDSMTTVAAAAAAVDLAVPVVHVEAGERLYRREGFPEEAHRVLTDHAASLCLTCTRRAGWNLGREGMGPERVQFVGDPLYDAFCALRSGAKDDGIFERFGVTREGFHLATLRRARPMRNPCAAGSSP